MNVWSKKPFLAAAPQMIIKPSKNTAMVWVSAYKRFSKKGYPSFQLQSVIKSLLLYTINFTVSTFPRHNAIEVGKAWQTVLRRNLDFAHDQWLRVVDKGGHNAVAGVIDPLSGHLFFYVCNVG